MNVEIKGNVKVITPSEGMWLTDGVTYSDSVYMGKDTDHSKWSEVSAEVKANAVASQSADEIKRENLERELENSGSEYAIELEKFLAEQGVTIAQHRQQLRNEIDSIGKVVQTIEGNGTMDNPYKGWKVGMTVEAGKWYSTTDSYLWQAIKSGTPSSTTDKEYFDVVGLE